MDQGEITYEATRVAHDGGSRMTAYGSAVCRQDASVKKSADFRSEFLDGCEIGSSKDHRLFGVRRSLSKQMMGGKNMTTNFSKMWHGKGLKASKIGKIVQECGAFIL
jgi:hypothetical protein